MAMSPEARKLLKRETRHQLVERIWAVEHRRTLQGRPIARFELLWQIAVIAERMYTLAELGIVASIYPPDEIAERGEIVREILADLMAEAGN